MRHRHRKRLEIPVSRRAERRRLVRRALPRRARADRPADSPHGVRRRPRRPTVDRAPPCDADAGEEGVAAARRRGFPRQRHPHDVLYHRQRLDAVLFL